MTNETMTIHKALCELKTLESRIDKALEGVAFVFPNKHSNAKVSGLNIDDYKAEIRSRYQSAKDLIARRDAIKRAVTLSNAKTPVTIGGQSYTVAEAIEMKNHGIPLQKKLLRKLNSDNIQARATADRSNGDMLERRADEYIQATFGTTDMKGASEEVKKSRADFIAAQTIEVVDPIGITSEIERISKEIDEFSINIDAALSVSNALTTIDIEY